VRPSISLLSSGPWASTLQSLLYVLLGPRGSHLLFTYPIPCRISSHLYYAGGERGELLPWVPRRGRIDTGRWMERSNQESRHATLLPPSSTPCPPRSNGVRGRGRPGRVARGWVVLFRVFLALPSKPHQRGFLKLSPCRAAVACE
jgi:hypothetical protein